MNWNLTCRKVRRSLALLSVDESDSDGELDAASASASRRHLAVCPHCREQWQRLHAAREALEQVRCSPRSLQASVWPSVERELVAVANPPSAVNDWRDWLPTGALVTACLTLWLAVSPTAVPESPVPRGMGFGLSPEFSPASVVPHRPWGNPSRFDRSFPRGGFSPLSEFPRVRTLLDGSEAREL